MNKRQRITPPLVSEVLSKLQTISGAMATLDSLKELHRERTLLKINKGLDFVIALILKEKEVDEWSSRSIFLQSLNCVATFLPLPDIKNLALCNSLVFKELSPIIAQQYEFRLPSNKIIYQFYKPTQFIAYGEQEIVGPIPLETTSLRLIPTRDHYKDPEFPTMNLPSLKKLDLGKGQFPLLLPPSLTHLTLYACYSLYLANLPPNLQYLKFGDLFNLPLLSLPLTLRHLVCGSEFNQSIDKLPPVLEILEIAVNSPPYSTKFIQSVDCLPPNLKSLTLHSQHFNHPLDHLPSSLLKLSLISYLFNQSLDHLPQSLTFLQLGHFKHQYYLNKFNYPINNLPNSIKYLEISSAALNYEITNLPSSLETLSLISTEFQISNLPSSLLKLSVKSYSKDILPQLPSSLTSLSLHSYSSRITFPSSLKFLKLNTFGAALTNLPHSLEELKLGYKFNQPISYFPSSLKIIRLCSSCIPKLPPLPPLLTHFLFSGKDHSLSSYHFPLPSFPNSLTHLSLPDSLSHPLPPLPFSLKYLRMENKHENLPSSLVEINKDLFLREDLSYLPTSIERITLTTLTLEDGQEYEKRVVRLPPLSPCYFILEKKPGYKCTHITLRFSQTLFNNDHE